MKVDKTTVTAVSVIAIAVLSVAGCKRLGVVGSLDVKSGVIVGAAILVVLFKLFVQDLIGTEPNFYRNGYDLCVMTLSTAMTSMAAEIFSVTRDATKLQIYFATLALSLVATLFAAKITKGIQLLPKGQPEGWRSGLIFTLGLALFVTNVVVILKKV